MAHDLHPGWRPARVIENRPVAAGSMWLRLQAVDDWAAAYEPGHVLGLGLKLYNGFMRHAYTVSRGEFRGPLFGCAEKTLREGETRPITLYASFREESHICLAAELNGLARRYPNFGWHYSLTRPSESWSGFRGRVTDWVPHEIGKNKLESHHFHLVGNGEMVHLVRSALYGAGVARERVSIETYFNHHVEPDDAEIDRLANQFRDSG